MTDCMKSFTLRTNATLLLSSGNGSIKTWGTVGQYFWSASNTPNNQTSIYNLEGFKRTNIYGCTVVGYVKGNPTSVNACALVTDWTFRISFQGTSPLISGQKVSAPDGWSLITTGPLTNAFALGKYTNSITFADPIQSVTSITFEALETQGMGAEFLNVVSINYDLIFTFYYDYEGE